jgi:hypothetical protein
MAILVYLLLRAISFFHLSVFFSSALLERELFSYHFLHRFSLLIFLSLWRFFLFSSVFLRKKTIKIKKTEKLYFCIFIIILLIKSKRTNTATFGINNSLVLSWMIFCVRNMQLPIRRCISNNGIYNENWWKEQSAFRQKLLRKSIFNT